MPSLLRTACPACGHSHNFCLQQGEVETGREYSCFCPESSTMATLTPPAAGEPVTHAPQGAVAMILKT